MLADRANRKNIMVVLDTLSGIAVFLVFLFFCEENSIPLIGGLLVALSILGAFESPTVQACVPQMQTGDNILKGNAVVNQISAVAALLTPFTGSIFYTAFGIQPILMTTAICFFLTAFLECFIQLEYHKPAQKQRIFQILREDNTKIEGQKSLLVYDFLRCMPVPGRRNLSVLCQYLLQISDFGAVILCWADCLQYFFHFCSFSDSGAYTAEYNRKSHGICVYHFYVYTAFGANSIRLSFRRLCPKCISCFDTHRHCDMLDWFFGISFFLPDQPGFVTLEVWNLPYRRMWSGSEI